MQLLDALLRPLLDLVRPKRTNGKTEIKLIWCSHIQKIWEKSMMIKDDENALKTTKVKRDETNFVQLMYADENRNRFQLNENQQKKKSNNI